MPRRTTRLGKLPRRAGWQPALPGPTLSREQSSSRQRARFRLEIPGNQTRPLVEREVGPGPLDQDDDTIAEAHEENDVDEKPRQPGRQPAEVDDVQIGH